MSSSITLSAATRQSMLALNTPSDLAKTQTRLTTSLKLGNSIENAASYFQTKALSVSSRVSDAQANKGQMQDAVSVIGAAVNGLSGIEGLLKQAKGIVESAAVSAGENASADTMKNYADQYNSVLKQIDQEAGNSSYNGFNLLSSGGNLSVSISSTGSETLTVQSKQLDTSNKSLNLQQVTTFTSDESARLQSLTDASTTVRNRSIELGTNAATISARIDFNKDFSNLLQEGSGKLTAADLNEEGANLVALQTRQQIGIQSFSFAGQQEQSILSLFR